MIDLVQLINDVRHCLPAEARVWCNGQGHTIRLTISIDKYRLQRYLEIAELNALTVNPAPLVCRGILSGLESAIGDATFEDRVIAAEIQLCKERLRGKV